MGMTRNGLVTIRGILGEHPVLDDLGRGSMLAYVGGQTVVISLADDDTWGLATRGQGGPSWGSIAAHAALGLVCVLCIAYVAAQLLSGCESWDSERWTPTSACSATIVGP